MHRGIRGGIAGIKLQEAKSQKLKAKGDELQKQQLEDTKTQMEQFRSNLEEFAYKYKKQIRKDPDFRRQFNELCMKIGVDPLASNKGFWSALGLGEFYYNLGVKIVEICLKTRSINGGIININELIARLCRRKGTVKVTEDDIERSVAKLQVLGKGMQIIHIGGNKMLQSVPCDLTNDHTEILELAEQGEGYVTVLQIQTRLNWDRNRIESTLNLLLQESMAWLDTQGESGDQYWFPSIYFSQKQNMSYLLNTTTSNSSNMSWLLSTTSSVGDPDM